MIVTIDGPAGSGKSSTARRVAKELGAVYIDTGAMYRAVTLTALEAGIDIDNADLLEELAARITITFTESDEGQATIINGRDQSRAIRSREVDAAVSAVSAHRPVREKLLKMQRKLAADCPKVVVEGRDTGSVVFPEADYKFFITAGHEARSRRRAIQTSAGSEELEKIAEEIAERDRIDSSRETAPLKIPEGAVVVDNSRLSLDETVKRIVQLVAYGVSKRQI